MVWAVTLYKFSGDACRKKKKDGILEGSPYRDYLSKRGSKEV